MIGFLGDYEFSVSSEQVRTFEKLSFSNSASYAEHKILGRKGLIEFTGLNASSATLSLYLYAYAGIIPADEISELYEKMNNHELLVFCLGGDVMGEGFWVIESLDEDYKRVDAYGTVIEANITLKLREYAGDVYLW